MRNDTHRANCFDLIRHAAAMAVLYSHQFALLNLPEPSLFEWQSYGGIAVAVFFSISGYLMPGSFIRSGNFIGFMRGRLRRLVPGLAVCSLITTYLVGTMFTSWDKWEYLTSIDALRIFVSVTFFLRREPPGAYSDFLVPGAINGSLWTLPLEFLCYVFIGIAMTYSRSWKTVLTLLLLSVAGTICAMQTGTTFSWYQASLQWLFPFGICFSSGALLAMTREAWWPHRGFMLGCAAVAFFILPGLNEMPVLGSIGVALVTIIVGTAFSEKLIRGRFDFSYGIYIYAYPIQQIVINHITKDLWLGMALAAVLTIIAGALSYYVVERPFMRRKAKGIAPQTAFAPSSS